MHIHIACAQLLTKGEKTLKKETITIIIIYYTYSHSPTSSSRLMPPKEKGVHEYSSERIDVLASVHHFERSMGFLL